MDEEKSSFNGEENAAGSAPGNDNEMKPASYYYKPEDNNNQDNNSNYDNTEYNNSQSQNNNQSDSYSQSDSSQGGYDNNQNNNSQNGYDNNQDNNSQSGYDNNQSDYSQNDNNQNGYSQNDNNQNGYSQNGYDYNQNNNGQNGYDYNQNNYSQPPYYNSQGSPNPVLEPPKKKKTGKVVGIVAGIVAFVLVMTAVVLVVVSAFKRLETYSKDRTDKETWEESVKGDDSDKKSDSEEEKNPVSTTEPVSVAQSNGSVSGATDVSGIVEAVMPCVVSIQSTCSVEGYSMFGQHYEQEVDASGTGFIVGQNDTEMLFATNNHVVEDATAIQVTFGDESTAEAIVKGTDAEADLAVVAVPIKDISNDTMEKIKVAVLGSSDEVKVGQMAIAIGNAQGMGQSVTVGYISAKDRKLDLQDESNGGTKTMTFLQTDAAINGGNSGGPLLDVNGNVVGINSAKISDTQVEGMCYAIPMSTAIPIINELMNRETLTEEEKGYMGISLKDVSNEAIEMYGVPDGVYVASLVKDAPAEKAGIKEGDIITEINGVAVTSQTAAADKISSYRAGTEIKLVLYRQSGSNSGYEAMDVSVTLVTAEEAGINNSKDSDKKNDSQNNDSEGQQQEPYSDDQYNGDNYGGDSYDDFFGGLLPW